MTKVSPRALVETAVATDHAAGAGSGTRRRRGIDRKQPRPVASMRLIIGAASAALISVTVIGVGWVAERNARATLTLETQSRLVLEARNLALVSAAALLSEFPELTLCPLVVEMQRDRDDVAFAVVLDHRGVIQGHKEPRLLGRSFDLVEEMTAIRTTVELAPGEGLYQTGSFLVAEVAARHDRQVLGRVLVGLRRSYLDALVTQSRSDLALFTAILLVAGITSSILLVSILLRPIGKLRRGLERIGRGDLDTPIELRDRTELGLLADTVNKMAAELKASYDEAHAKEVEIIDTQKEVIQTLGDVVESRSKETANHIVRVGECSKLLASLAGLDEDEAQLVQLASPMHDVGKIAIPDAILKKPGLLTDEEFDVVRSHTTVGYELLRKSNRPIMRSAAIIAHEHHEKWDGSGYPRRIAGEDIHIYGRIVAIVDVFDALRSPRAYKQALSVEETLEIMREDRGKHFDPRLLDLFIGNLDEFLEIHERYAPEAPEGPLQGTAREPGDPRRRMKRAA